MNNCQRGERGVAKALVGRQERRGRPWGAQADTKGDAPVYVGVGIKLSLCERWKMQEDKKSVTAKRTAGRGTLCCSQNFALPSSA